MEPLTLLQRFALEEEGRKGSSLPFLKQILVAESSEIAKI